MDYELYIKADRKALQGLAVKLINCGQTFEYTGGMELHMVVPDFLYVPKSFVAAAVANALYWSKKRGHVSEVEEYKWNDWFKKEIAK